MSFVSREKIMTISGRAVKPFTARFLDEGSGFRLELTNETDQTLKSVEILAIFLKDEETPGGGPSRANIKFEAINCLRPRERAVLSHKTWIDGKPVDHNRDQLGRLTIIAGEVKPYVLDISWEDADGRSQFQRIPVGH
jgi:hypothetical protein